jgi:hypothetical protein
LQAVALMTGGTWAAGFDTRTRDTLTTAFPSTGIPSQFHIRLLHFAHRFGIASAIQR